MIKYTCGAGTPEEAETNCTYFIRGECTASFCEYRRKKQTNADRIRAMSNENLAYILGKFCKEMAYCIVCPLYGSGCPMSSNFNDWVKWLQQPVEGE